MKIALCQMKMTDCIEKNKETSLCAVTKAAQNGADLVLFPEIQCCPFFPQYEKLDVSAYRMTLDDPFVLSMRELCKENHIMAAPNIYLYQNGRSYDATLLIGSDGELIGLQKMVHIAQAECFFEQDYYAPAEEGFRVFETEHGKIGIVVCFDRHYPESIRTEALMGADLILIPTANTSAEPSDMFEWELRVQAFQSSVALAMCNRVGLEGGMNFCGESIVVDATGSALMKADGREEMFYADIDLASVGKIRNSKTYIGLRRTDLYM